MVGVAPDAEDDCDRISRGKRMRQWELFGITDSVPSWVPRKREPVPGLTPAPVPEPEPLDPVAGVEPGIAMDGFPSLLWTTDESLRFTSTPGAERAGLPPGAPGVVAAFDDPEVVDAHACAVAGGASTFDMRRNGRTFRCWVSPVRAPDGEVCGTICVGLEQLEAELLLDPTVEFV